MLKPLLLAALIAAHPAKAAAPAIQLSARGVQIYTCAPASGAYAWHLKAPDADLFDAHGHLAAHHSAGPTWRAIDGSTVTGEKLAESAAPAPGDIPWLVLRARTHAGAGLFATVAYITRTLTEGGAAPKSGCDAAHAGAEARSAYSATYTLFPG